MTRPDTKARRPTVRNLLGWVALLALMAGGLRGEERLVILNPKHQAGVEVAREVAYPWSDWVTDYSEPGRLECGWNTVIRQRAYFYGTWYRPAWAYEIMLGCE
jgi:hypothetical protein